MFTTSFFVTLDGDLSFQVEDRVSATMRFNLLVEQAKRGELPVGTKINLNKVGKVVVTVVQSHLV